MIVVSIHRIKDIGIKKHEMELLSKIKCRIILYTQFREKKAIR